MYATDKLKLHKVAKIINSKNTTKYKVNALENSKPLKS